MGKIYPSLKIINCHEALAMSLIKRVIFFIDGENLVMRYQSMVEEGRKPLNGILHERDIYVWHSDIIKNEIRNILRVTYYTYATGSEEKLLEIKKQIQSIQYQFSGEKSGGGGRYGGAHQTRGMGNVIPCVFKKNQQSAKRKGVDIQMTIDMLNSSLMENVDALYLLSGDGDFVPLIREVMRRGKQVYVMALSDGLNPELQVTADGFELLDSKIFQC